MTSSELAIQCLRLNNEHYEALLYGALSGISCIAWASADAGSGGWLLISTNSRPSCKPTSKRLADWPNLGRYRDEDEKIQPGAVTVVFMGDSITDFWGRQAGEFFPGKPYLNRGISGQTTPQMLLRFRQDVLDLKPKAVVILGGTNDIAGNTGPESLEEIEGYLESMTELAQADGIRVILSSLTPVCDYQNAQQTVRRPPGKIVALNAWMKVVRKEERSRVPGLLRRNHG